MNTELGKQVAQAREAAHQARRRLTELEALHQQEELLPVMRQQLGKCYRYRNCYSCPQGEADYWWLYARVVGIQDGNYVLACFQRDPQGRIEISREVRMPGSDGQLAPEYQQIAVADYQRAVAEIVSKARTLDLMDE